MSTKKPASLMHFTTLAPGKAALNLSQCNMEDKPPAEHPPSRACKQHIQTMSVLHVLEINQLNFKQSQKHIRTLFNKSPTTKRNFHGSIAYLIGLYHAIAQEFSYNSFPDTLSSVIRTFRLQPITLNAMMGINEVSYQ
jgi:hypothetical protein